MYHNISRYEVEFTFIKNNNVESFEIDCVGDRNHDLAAWERLRSKVLSPEINVESLRIDWKLTKFVHILKCNGCRYELCSQIEHMGEDGCLNFIDKPCIYDNKHGLITYI